MNQEIKVLNLTDETEFEDIVNGFLAEGWKISSTSCGFVNSENYDFCTSFQAILTRSTYDKVSYEIFKDDVSRAKYL